MIRTMTLLALLAMMLPTAVLADLTEDRAKADALLEAGEERKAFKAYRTLARDGDHHAQFTLAEMYEVGVGTKVDLIDAYAWSVLAAESGVAELGTYSRQVLARVDDQAKAERVAQKLKNKYGQEALALKAERLAVRGAGRRYGACTGSRVACAGRVEAIGLNGSESVAIRFPEEQLIER